MSVEDINKRLIDTYGTDISSNQPIFRVVFSAEQTEKRTGEFEDRTESGLFIRRVRETREVLKYPWINPPAFVIERLTGVEGNPELVTKMSYEPIFTFYHFKTGVPLEPIWSVTRIVIDAVLFAANHPNPFAKYKDKTPEEKEQELGEMMNYLYGDTNATTDALAYKEGVVVPNNYEG